MHTIGITEIISMKLSGDVMTRPLLEGLTTGLLLLFFGMATQAQSNAADDRKTAEVDTAFQAMLDAPASMEAILNYARASTAAGDYEGAIGALERLLLINSNMPIVQADLGLLYYRLESYPIAQLHLKGAMEQADKLPPVLRVSVKRTLRRLDKRLSRNSFSGIVSLGLRYQTNANSGPQNSLILSAGTPILLDSNSREKADWNVNLYSRIRHQYDLRTQNDASLDNVLTVYATRYDEIGRLDTSLLEFSPGIRFKPAPTDLKDLSLRPHLIGRIYKRDGDRYSDSLGLGLDAQYRINEGLIITGTVQYRDRDYKASAARPNLNQLDGNETSLRMRALVKLTRKTILTLQGDLIDRKTRRDFRDAREVGLLGAINTAYAPLFGEPSRPWKAHLSLSYRNADYDAPDPRIDPTRSREDDRWRIEAGTTIPIADDWGLRLGLARSSVDSNIPNFKRDNTQFNMNFVGRF